MTQSKTKLHFGQAPNESVLGGVMQRQIFNTDHGRLGKIAKRFRAHLAIAGLLLLSACGNSDSVTENNLPDHGKDGVQPTLTSVSIRESTKTAKPGGTVKLGKSARIDIVASEGLMTPLVTINGVNAEVQGSVNNWFAVREMTETDVNGDIYFSIVYQDISGELGQAADATTDGSALLLCDDDCPEPVTLPGDWRLDSEGVGALGVGPASGDISWWASDADTVVIRACLFDDVFNFGSDGSFSNIQGDETWIEPWQGTDPEACGAPVAPHDGSTSATWEYDEAAATLTISGLGAHLGLPKAVNGVELGDPAAAPDSVVYDVLALDGDSMTVTIDSGTGWWTFRLARAPVSPLAGQWKLDGEGAAGVGPSSGDTSWWVADAAAVTARACWFDDVFVFGADGSFENDQGTETWLEPWQGVAAESCGAPVAPHDGSNGAIFDYDEDAGTLKLTGRGAHLGLPKAVNGEELTDPAAAPESVTYDVLILDGDNLTVTIDSTAGWWTFRLTRVSNSPVVGKWKLAGEGSAGVGPTAGDTSWWLADADAVAARACWFDDVFHFGADGTFQNYQGTETWLEPWQGTDPEACGAPVAPHDGSARAVFDYDAAASTLTLNGKGAHLGLPKAVNGAELADPAAAPDSVVYDVLALDGDSMTVTIDVGNGWWTFQLERVNDTAPLAGKWTLDGEGAAGVGPTAGDTSWWVADADAVVARACWFDDVFDFGADGSFQNDQGTETWLEPWQGTDPEACGAPVAPHDGSARAVFDYDEAASTLTLHGKGAHLGLAKAVNGAELADPAAAPESVTYDVLTLDGDNMTVTIDVANGWWTFNLVRVSNSPLAGNWKLDGEGAAGVGPTAGDTSWWVADADAVAARACWFDDVFHFGAGGSFQNFQEGDTWLEPWQGTDPEACGAPVAPHDGSSAGSYFWDEAAGTLTILGMGSHLGLPKVVNGAELTDPGSAPDSITYDVLTLDTDVITVTADVANGWWTFRLAKD
jgi:hypothetical protein